MALLILGLVVFLGTHSLLMARGIRAPLMMRLGRNGYRAAFSILSLVGLVLIVIGFGRYRADGYIPVWDPPAWTRHITMLLMWFAFVAVIAAYVPGRIKRTLKHPMMAGIKAWAVAHLITNGDLGSILLFGSFLVWAVLVRIDLKRRTVVEDHGGPLAAPAGMLNDVIAVAVATALYLAFVFGLHAVLIGVPVLPPRG